MNAHAFTADIACSAFRAMRDEDDHLAIEVYRAAHEAHLTTYAESNPQGAARARASRRGLWSVPRKKQRDERASVYEDDDTAMVPA